MNVNDKIDNINKNNLEILDLSHCNLIEIPKDIFSLTQLKSLDLSYNSIDVLDNDFSKLINLEHLNLNHNNLKYITPIIGKLVNLKELSVNCNQLIEFSHEISFLNNLISLDLSSNLLKEIPIEISKLDSIEYLDICSNKIEFIPSDFIKANLTSFAYTHNHLSIASIKAMIAHALSLNDKDYISDIELKNFVNDIINEKNSIDGFWDFLKEKLNNKYSNENKEMVETILWNITLAGSVYK